MEHHGLDELVNLVGDSVVRIISKIWSRFVGGTGSGRALPSRNVDSGDILGEVDELDGVKSTESVVDSSGLVSREELSIELLGEIMSGIGELDGSSEFSYFFSRVVSGNSVPSWLSPPVLDFFSLLLDTSNIVLLEFHL
jgi:hypothetical protein